MHGVRLRVAYDGSDFAGWQTQRAQRTVQGELERAISELTGDDVQVRGCSRTDAGVHAHAQIAAFDTARDLPSIGWVRGLNGKLTHDIAVIDAERCEVGYNPRFDAVAKTYRYLLHLGPVRDPLLRNRAWHLGPRRARPWRGDAPPPAAEWLDTTAMHEAAKQLEGEHDFRAFQAAGDIREQTVRTLTMVRLVERYEARDDLLAIEVRGNAFLQHMVRIIVGTLVEVGRERMKPSDVAALLGEKGERERAGETAPSCGLYLVSIETGREK
jgi:tRNA pseudouridine38-40 synthase